MRALRQRLAKIENSRKYLQAEPLVIVRTIVEPDGTESKRIREVIRRL